MSDLQSPRLLRWEGGLTIIRQKPGDLVVAGVLATGERPVANDELVRLAADGAVWRVAEVATRFRAPSGPLSVTLYLLDPESTLP